MFSAHFLSNSHIQSQARKRVAKQVGEMEAASIAAEIGLLNVATGKTRTQAQESLLSAADEMNKGLAVLLEAARAKVSFYHISDSPSLLFLLILIILIFAHSLLTSLFQDMRDVGAKV
jgi:hypothetical protein